MRRSTINSYQLRQEPEPGVHLLRFKGDCIAFILSLESPMDGNAWLRTNLGHGAVLKSEIIKEVENGNPRLGRDWFDIPMQRVEDNEFRIRLPLCEPGHFEAKSFFLKSNENFPAWPEGDNVTINVLPADSCCANIIYNTFVRQFSPAVKNFKSRDKFVEDAAKLLDNEGYTVIPPSGTFRDLIAELDFIIGKLGCRYIQLLPIHPTPTTYGRMGRFGSPYASLSFTDVDPALAKFDPKATPVEQFIELVDAVHSRDAKIILDIAINHTGWAASLHESHPEWLVRDEKGRIEEPGAWGVVWADLTRLDFSKKDLWKYMSGVFLLWCQRGVDGFRCDAGYMVPVRAWRYIVAMVREQFPNTIFFLEGLGGKISVTRKILDKAGFDWAYSELFQNYDQAQIHNYLPQAIEISMEDGVMVNFAETHDNLRLASKSTIYAKMRTSLCALCSINGGFGFAGGVEWYAFEKINVHKATSLNWGASNNQVEHIRKLNDILKSHPAFHDNTSLKLILVQGGNEILLKRVNVLAGRPLFILANLDHENASNGSWNSNESGMDKTVFFDLLTGKSVALDFIGDRISMKLEPGEVVCLSSDQNDLDLIKHTPHGFYTPDRITKQRFRSKALEVLSFYKGITDLGNFDPDLAAGLLMKDPVDFCRRMNPANRESRTISWYWPRDINREVMIPPKHFPLIFAGHPFRAKILNNDRAISSEESLPLGNGKHFCLFQPISTPPDFTPLRLNISVFAPEKFEHGTAPLLLLPNHDKVKVKTMFTRKEIIDNPLLFLGTNGRGGMIHIRVPWGKIESRYDALLGANQSKDFPEDRRIMLTRCRAWAVFQGFSQPLDQTSIDAFNFHYDSKGQWEFHIPMGQGENIRIITTVRMVKGANTMILTFFRPLANELANGLPDDKSVTIIIRPDIEDRSFHEATKAYMGPESNWPKCIDYKENGFVFSPGARRLEMKLTSGGFVQEPEWQYMVNHKEDALRGFDPDSDLFSPGYFWAKLKGGEKTILAAEVLNPDQSHYHDEIPVTNESFNASTDPELNLGQAMDRAVSHFISNRNRLKTVIAGYPWFLDWGRDSLIFSRGLIASGRLAEARDIILQFGTHEKNGTLPNMINGRNAENRDTSDAALWFFVACHELILKENNEDLLDMEYGSRSIREILLSIGENLIKGTPNNMVVDPETGLLFSPSHFTWMDTNHPAGTPRCGYPVEIQALWNYALRVLAEIAPGDKAPQWKTLSEMNGNSITRLFFLENKGYLSDCLHLVSSGKAANGEKDDALRPNQIFAITLGAVNDFDIQKKILESSMELLVPGAMRSLADRPLERPLAIEHHGRIINDPVNPYKGKYIGDEDYNRKPAYHNGTAWTWLFPSFCEAWAMVFGSEGRNTALSWLAGSAWIVNQGCVGQVPEIVDGDFPHVQRGCSAQAWGASEILRVWNKLCDH